MPANRKKEVAIGTAVAIAAAGAVTGAAQAKDFKVTNTKDSGPGSLRHAMNTAETFQDGRILFASGVSGTINLESDLPSTTSSLNIRGPGQKRLTIDGGGRHSIFSFNGDATISGLTLENGYDHVPVPIPPPCNNRCGNYYQYTPPNSGALAIGNADHATVRNVTFTGNVGDQGGAISAYRYSENGSSHLTVIDSTFVDNVSLGSGGAISTHGSTSAEISGSEFTGNSSVAGGAIGLNGSGWKVRDSTFEGNQSSGPGGAAFLSGGGYGKDNQVLSGSTFVGNTALEDGGGASMSGQFQVKGTTFSGNTAHGAGGGLAIGSNFSPFGGDVSTVSNSTISGNEAEVAPLRDSHYGVHGGGGVSINDGAQNSSVVIRNSTVASNDSHGFYGGGVLSSSPGLTLNSVTITGNRALPEDGAVRGGGFFQTNGQAYVRNSIISGNTATSEQDMGTLPLENGHPFNPDTSIGIEFSVVGDSAGAEVDATTPGSNFFGADPKLGPLTDNGGPTKTMLPSPDSVAVNGGFSKLKRDQRGKLRPVKFAGKNGFQIEDGNQVDMGAVELQDNRFDIGPLTFNRKRGASYLKVTVRSAGRASILKSNVVAFDRRATLGPRSVDLKVVPKGAAAKKLERDGVVRIKARIRFRPDPGRARTRNVRLTLRQGTN